MDDDAPLSALAKAPKFDDDTPLASLADLKQKAAAKSAPKTSTLKGSPKAVVPGKGKQKGRGTPIKRKAGSSSSSSSSDSEESSSSESGGKPKKKAVSKKKAVPKKKVKTLQPAQTEENMEDIDGGGAINKRNRTSKEQAVAELLCRWWYVLPDWPPVDDAYYQAELAKRQLRKVTIEEWEWVAEEDSKGNKKVYELSQFRGLFRASNGDLVDVRPKDTCPNYVNFMKKDLPEVYDLLVTALENQIKDLKNSSYNEKTLEQELKVKLTSVREKAHAARQLSGAKKKNG